MKSLPQEVIDRMDEEHRLAKPRGTNFFGDWFILEPIQPGSDHDFVIAGIPDYVTVAFAWLSEVGPNGQSTFSPTTEVRTTEVQLDSHTHQLRIKGSYSGVSTTICGASVMYGW